MSSSSSSMNIKQKIIAVCLDTGRVHALSRAIIKNEKRYCMHLVSDQKDAKRDHADLNERCPFHCSEWITHIPILVKKKNKNKNNSAPEVKVGDNGQYSICGDHYAYKITAVENNGKTIHTSSQNSSGEWSPSGTYTWRRTKEWVPHDKTVRYWHASKASFYVIGAAQASTSLDPSF